MGKKKAAAAVKASSTVMATAGKLTQSQRSMVSKVINLRFNTIINQLKVVTTLEEAKNRPHEWPWDMYTGSDTEIDVLGNEPLSLKQTVRHLPSELQKRLLTLQKVNVSADKAYYKARKIRQTTMDGIKAHFDHINDKRKVTRDKARQARASVVDAMRAERDQAILDLAFAGDDSFVKDILAQLPTSETVNKSLKLNVPIKVGPFLLDGNAAESTVEVR